MTCRNVLSSLLNEVDSWSCERHISCKDHELARRNRAYGVRDSFLLRYPFVAKPARINALTAKALYNPGSGNEYFLKGIVWSLKALGGIGLRDVTPLEAAAVRIDDFRELLSVALNEKTSLAEKIDASWDRIPGFVRGDRVVVRQNSDDIFSSNHRPDF